MPHCIGYSGKEGKCARGAALPCPAENKKPPLRRVLSSVILDQLHKPGLDLVTLPKIAQNSNPGDHFEIG